MSEINTYVVVDRDNEYVSEEYDSLAEAINAAQRRGPGHAVVELTYVFDDSSLAWTPNGSDYWPSDESDEEHVGGDES